MKIWFDEMVEVEAPDLDGSLAAERDAAEAYARMAKAENTRRAYRAAVRAWCDWCRHRNLPPLPGSGADVAAFLAAERGRGLTPETLKLRRAAIRYLHRAAGCPVPTDDVAVFETLAGIRRQAAKKGYTPSQRGPVSCTRSWRQSRWTYPACATARCCSLASRARCAVRSWLQSVSTSWNKPSAALSLPAWIVVSIRPGSNGLAAIRASMCWASISNSVICSRAIR